jgi:predicted RNase H-like HicB family nuclease
MHEITFNVERDEEAACFIASWDDPAGKGGITTQGEDLRELQEMILDATTAYFHASGTKAPSRVRLHFIADPELLLA